MRAQRLRYIILAAVFLAIVWLGHWIGYMSRISQNEPAKLELGADRLKVDSKIKDNIFHVNSDVQKNEAVNNIQDFNAQHHVLGIHKGHARQIIESLHAKKGTVIPTPKLEGQEVIRNTTDEKVTGLKNAPSTTIATANLARSHNQMHNSTDQIKDKMKIERNKQEPLLAVGERYRQEHQHREPQEGDVHAPLSRNGEVPSNIGQTNNMLQKKESSIGDIHYILMHAGQASKVHGQIHAKLQPMPDTIPKEAYILTSESLPKDSASRPSIGNGYIATMIHSGEVYVQGLYNGRRNESHRAVIPSTCSLNITETEPPTKFRRQFRLNTGEGIYSEVTTTRSFTVTHRIFAHRTIKHLLVVEIDLERKYGSTPLKLKLDLTRKWKSSHDLTFTALESGMEEVSYKKGTINTPEHESGTYDDIHILYDHVPSELSAPADTLRTKWVFLSSIASTFLDAQEAYKRGQKLVHGNDDLYGSHVKAWSKLWSEGRIDVDGNLGVAKTVYSSWYYILSSLPLEVDRNLPFVGLSPSGLPLGKYNQGFQGRVLWDQEIWMYPNLLLFHNTLAKTILDSRLYTHKNAKVNAGTDAGAQFATESGATGLELSSRPDSAKQNYHVTGMVSYAILQYLYATNNTAILEGEHYVNVLADIANFWVSKLHHDMKTDTYKLRGVNPPDISHPNVDNPAFTTALAHLSLAAPEYAFNLINKTVGFRWHQFIQKTGIPFDDKNQYHPAYDGFAMSTSVFQADTVLLGYPLLRPMPTEARENDLRLYEKNTRPDCNPTTWAMHAIGWFEVDKFSKGQQSFAKQFAYIQNEFKVWSDRPLHGATNYLSGMGGFLQSIFNGYGGFRLRNDRLDFNPSLPGDISALSFVGIDYMGSSIDFIVRDDELTVILTSQLKDIPLKLYLYNPEEIRDLQLNQAVRVKKRKGAVITAYRKFPQEI